MCEADPNCPYPENPNVSRCKYCLFVVADNGPDPNGGNCKSGRSCPFHGRRVTYHHRPDQHHGQ